MDRSAQSEEKSPPGAFLRLTYAAAPVDLLDEGVRRLARALGNSYSR